MGEKTGIAWADHTFNAWWGCEKVSPACASCYAESLSNRFGDDLWGHSKPRKFFGDAYWAKPLAWDRKAGEAGEAGERRRVFTNSMADVFEDRRDLDAVRERLWKLIERTPNLIWMLLTKRPENIRRFTGGNVSRNTWLGVTAENQREADRRVPLLLDSVKASVYFVSGEPLLERVTLASSLGVNRIGWVIVGGESGANARPMHPSWARALRDEAKAAHVPFFFKQWGEFVPVEGEPRAGDVEFVAPPNFMRRVGTKRAGALLDGVWHDAVPAVSS